MSDKILADPQTTHYGKALRHLELAEAATSDGHEWGVMYHVGVAQVHAVLALREPAVGPDSGPSDRLDSGAF